MYSYDALLAIGTRAMGNGIFGEPVEKRTYEYTGNLDYRECPLANDNRTARRLELFQCSRPCSGIL